MPGLFRSEALEAHRYAGFGRAGVRLPVSLTAWCVLAVAFAVAVVALLVFGQYTKRTRVPGITVPAGGQVKLITPQAGIVMERHVEEGQVVAAGDVLFVLSSERRVEAGGGSAGVQTAILDQLRRREASLREERRRLLRLGEEQSKAAERRLAVLRTEAAQLSKERTTQAARESSAAEHAARYDALARRGFVSAVAARQARDELLEQTARGQMLERSRLAIEREIGAARAELAQLPLHAERQHAELERELATLQQEVIGAALATRMVITAPQAGVVTAIVAERGQSVGAQPLATLLPTGGALEAQLFAPSRAIGFVEAGQRVRVRYAAYPYQKFGQYGGEVVHVSRVALAPAELPPQLGLPANGEALYRITVRLETSNVMAYGRPQPLTAGMQLEADVMQDRRRLIEWVFEPLIALGRKT